MSKKICVFIPNAIRQMLIKHGRCVRITDAGVITIANSCTSLEFLRYLKSNSRTLCFILFYDSFLLTLFNEKKNCSLFGIVGVTDKCLEALSQTCSATLTTLDVNGCIGIKVCTMKSFQFSFFFHPLRYTVLLCGEARG